MSSKLYAYYSKNGSLRQKMRISVKRCCGVAENSFADTRYFYSMRGNDPYWGLQKIPLVNIIQGFAPTRLFHCTTFCWEDTPTGKNLVPPINTRSPVVELVKLMACRQAKSPLKITTWSGGHKWFCLPESSWWNTLMYRPVEL